MNKNIRDKLCAEALNCGYKLTYMNKQEIKAENHGIVHYHAGCFECDWKYAIGNGIYPQNVRNKVRSHVMKTSHKVWIEKGIITHYNLKTL